MIDVYTEHGSTSIPSYLPIPAACLVIEEINEEEDNGIVGSVISNDDSNVNADSRNVNVENNNDKGEDVNADCEEGVNVDDRNDKNDKCEDVNVDCDESVNLDDGDDHITEEDSESDYIVDKGNNMDDRQVDMKNYKLNIDVGVVNNIKVVDKYDFNEEVLENETFDSGPESDNEANSIRRHSLRVIKNTQGLLEVKGKDKGQQEKKGKDEGLKENDIKDDKVNIEGNHGIPIKAVQEQFQRRYELNVSKMKAYRAKIKAKKQVQGDYKSQYTLLKSYVDKLLNTNPRLTIKIEVEPVKNSSDNTRIFKRIYVCLGALKHGFKAIGRELLGLDGAFMNGPYPGQILSTIGADPNNNIYPVAYAIVEA
ncbi:suppressor of Mek1-like [Helianthus annuus]|uniref:suppressor of Mek1-like n=1 Tax=Helianthus annuus TaxID=4232 RepID=UPI000B8FD15A|nr:suppressor of Mek1-like [Helianthus annuus]